MYEATNQPNNQTGFIALTTAIVISTSLLIFVIAIGFEGYFSRYTVLQSDFKEKSLQAADACAHTALLELSQDFEYQPNPAPEEVVVGTETCNIVAVSGTGNVRTVEIQSVVDRAVTNLIVEVYQDGPDRTEIVSWEEVATLP